MIAVFRLASRGAFPRSRLQYSHIFVLKPVSFGFDNRAIELDPAECFKDNWKLRQRSRGKRRQKRKRSNEAKGPMTFWMFCNWTFSSFNRDTWEFQKFCTKEKTVFLMFSSSKHELNHWMKEHGLRIPP